VRVKFIWQKKLVGSDLHLLSSSEFRANSRTYWNLWFNCAEIW
jgi:hypothetical protein